MARRSAANYVIILKHETLSGKRKSGEQHRRNHLLRHSLIAAAFALATITSSGLTGNAPPANVSDNPRYRTVVHHVYTCELAPSPDYHAPHYAPGCVPAYALAASITALPDAAVCLAFSLIGA
jgi:hypothetical protein